MIKTKIEWSDSTWSPVTGCYHPCPYCYARSTANRFKGCDCAAGGETDENVVYLKERLTVTSKDGVVRNAAYPFGFTPTFHEYRLNDPLTKGFGKTIFVCSMADLFGDWVPDEWIKKVFDACKAASGHRYLFLTKNPARYISIGRALADDMLEKVELVAPDCVNVSATRATYEAEVREALKGYASRQPSGEEMHEMRSVFGAGTTVVDVLSGRRYAV